MRRVFYIIILFSVISIPVTRGTNFYWNDVDSNFPVEKLQTLQYKIASNNHTITINHLNPESFVTIFDASGRNVYKRVVNDGFVSIPVRQRGVYIVRIKNGKDIYTQKILVN